MACKLDYWRADNSWAPEGSPDGSLPGETITLQIGQSRDFNTDWKYEKNPNDGKNYYGSHLRLARNNGDQAIDLRVRSGTGFLGSPTERSYRLARGQEQTFKADLMRVSCPKV